MIWKMRDTNVIDTKWDKRFMRLAKEVSSWSKDPSSKIGAVAVSDDRRILSTGFNGFPRGIEDTEERLNDREQKYPRIIHAEMNCLLGALYNGVCVRDATLYVYGLPVCSECAKAVIQAGIKRVVIGTDLEYVPEKWTNAWIDHSAPMFKEAGVSQTWMNIDHWNFHGE